MRTKIKTNSADPSKSRSVVKRLANLTSLLVTRNQYGQALGQSFEGDRQLYDVCGYPLTITYDKYQGRYQRDPLAKRIVNAYPQAMWRVQPDVYENDKAADTMFEKEWMALVEKLNLFHYFSRVDKLAGIGRYAVLFLGFDDGKDPKEECKKASTLVYVQAYGEGVCQIIKCEEDSKNPRYGKPTLYRITPNVTESNVDRTSTVATVSAGAVKPFDAHWTRILHVADETLDNDVYGTPRLEAVWNTLQNIELTCSGSAEAFWRAGYPGLQFVTPPDATVADEDGLEDEIEEYVHGLSRYMRLQNIEAKAVPNGGPTAAPFDHFQMQLANISAATGIPVRILVGSERGELASSQDERGWHDRIAERRDSFGTAIVVRPFVQRMIDVGVLPEPKELKIDWPPIEEMNESEKMDIANKKIKATTDYINGGCDAIFPPAQFLVEILGYDPEQAKDILAESEDYQEEQEKQAVEDAKNNPPPPAPGEAAGAPGTGVSNPPPATTPAGPQPVPPPAQARRMKIKAQAEEGGVWRTINGSPVFIKEGQSVEDAIKEKLGGGKGEKSEDKNDSHKAGKDSDDLVAKDQARRRAADQALRDKIAKEPLPPKAEPKAKSKTKEESPAEQTPQDKAWQELTLPLRKRLSFGDEVVFRSGTGVTRAVISESKNDKGEYGVKDDNGKTHWVPLSSLRMPKGGRRVRDNNAETE
jgi:hypothetical protein